mgnify:CR=1 FL=1
MDRLTKKLLSDVEAFCKEFDIPESTLSSRVANDGKTFARIAAGGSCTLPLYVKFCDEMAAVRKRGSWKTPRVETAA